jgi:hypothetical protein
LKDSIAFPCCSAFTASENGLYPARHPGVCVAYATMHLNRTIFGHASCQLLALYFASESP